MDYPLPTGAVGTCGFCHTSHPGNPCGTEDRPLPGKSLGKCAYEGPVNLCCEREKGHSGNHTGTFLGA
jgi:hypothetical protein